MSHAGGQWEIAWRSHIGCVRQRNEDAVAVDAEQGLVAVADGIGGGPGGQVASSRAVEAVLGWLREEIGGAETGAELEALLRDAVRSASVELVRVARDTPALRGLGTTLVVGVLTPGQLVYGHLGDSRLYHLRAGRLEQLTRDHSLLQEAVDRGQFPSLEAARRAGISDNIITRSLGERTLRGPDTAVARLEAGDLFLICTDGLTNLVDDATLAEVLAADAPLEATADTLVRLACERGGYDNVTVALVRVGADAQSRSCLSR
jgi:protein phosphatase